MKKAAAPEITTGAVAFFFHSKQSKKALLLKHCNPFCSDFHYKTAKGKGRS